MKENINIVSLLASDNYFVVNRDLIKIIGLKPAVLFSELCSEQNFFNKKEDSEECVWFYATQDKLQDKTGLSAYEQREALKVLVEENLVETKKQGIPCQTWYKICLEQVVKNFDNKKLKNSTTRSENFSQHTNNNNKEEVNYNNKNNNIEQKPKTDCIDDYFKNFTNNERLLTALRDFKEYRKKKREALTEQAVKLLLKKLDGFTVEEQIEALETSMLSGWVGVFPKKHTENMWQTAERKKVTHEGSYIEQARRDGYKVKENGEVSLL